MAISHQELQTIAFTLANEESPLLHFKSGFVDGEHQLIAVFSECEEVINTGWGCQMDNVKKLNDLMGCTPSEPPKFYIDIDDHIGGYCWNSSKTAIVHNDWKDCYAWDIRNNHGALVMTSMSNDNVEAPQCYTTRKEAQAEAEKGVAKLVAKFESLKGKKS
ncbi:hypothetical protein SIPHO059v1_p0086 [Vibrio phage 264E42.1]|nr:hypothetical protein SIPHO059v1_p0086 [Vibrio phage 264E42.1]